MGAQEKDSCLVDYCNTGIQTIIKPHMRKIVCDWMLEVCEDQGCVPHVLHTAINYLDTFLSSYHLDKKYFQSVGSGCLLLASKFTEVRPLSTEKLSLYTDRSVSPSELKHWELVILNVLNWQLSTVTTQTFIDHFIQTCGNTTSTKLNHKVRQHAEILAATAATEYKFMMVRPSLMAAAALSAASAGLSANYPLPHQLHKYHNQIEVVVEHLEMLLAHNLKANGVEINGIDQTMTQNKHDQFVTQVNSSPRDVHEVDQNIEQSSALPPFHTLSKICYS